MSNHIVIAGEKFPINANVILWNESNGMIFEKNITKHDLTLEQARKTIHSLVLHTSVTTSAKNTFDVLNSRELSVNFIIDDNDSESCTIYQTMDLIHSGWSQKNFNNLMRGVEVSYWPQAWQNSKFYQNESIKHDIVDDKVHGINHQVFAPSKGQTKAVAELCKTICKALNILPIFPKDGNGNYIKTVLAEPELWTGLCCHYHLDKQKIDASGLDHKFIEDYIKNSL